MSSTLCNNAILDILKYGRGFLKFISPNDTKATRSHQSGFFLPKKAREIFTPQPPDNGVNHTHNITITWQNGVTTESRVKWYGNLTRDEYRLTTFGHGFQYREPENIGNLLVLIPIVTQNNFRAYVLSNDEDIEDIQAALGLEITDVWALYSGELEIHFETEQECINDKFIEFIQNIHEFPKTKFLSESTQSILNNCIENFVNCGYDERILDLVNYEYKLYQMIESRICLPQIKGPFDTIEAFLKIALSITNRRKARAGKSLEHHVEYLLDKADIDFESQVDLEGKPDIIIPSREAYEDPNYPDDRLFHLGIKRTCKDRWRQVVKAAPRIKHKHIFTIQQGISGNQLDEMAGQHVTLVVPQQLHTQYPEDQEIELLSLEEFITMLRNTV